MAWQYSKHYTREEARALLPQVRAWLEQLTLNGKQLINFDQQMIEPLSKGNDLGGELVQNWVRMLAQTRDILQEFRQREIQIKDLDRGLIDFPALKGGREVFLCWEKDELDIEYWHDLTSGYAGRARID